MKEIGVAETQRHVGALNDELVAGVEELGGQVVTPERRGALVVRPLRGRGRARRGARGRERRHLVARRQPARLAARLQHPRRRGGGAGLARAAPRPARVTPSPVRGQSPSRMCHARGGRGSDRASATKARRRRTALVRSDPNSCRTRRSPGVSLRPASPGAGRSSSMATVRNGGRGARAPGSGRGMRRAGGGTPRRRRVSRRSGPGRGVPSGHAVD